MAWPSTGSYTAWSTCAKITTQADKISQVLDWYTIDLSLMPSAWWSAVRSDGADIRCTSDGETAVDHDLVDWNYGANTGLLAIAQPHGTSGATVDVDSYVYAGNAGASSTESASVYPSTMTCLYWLQEEPTSSTAIKDATANARHSTAIYGSMTSGDLISGGPHSGLKAIDFDSNDRAAVPSTLFTDVEAANAFTWFGWVYPEDDEADHGIFGAAGTQLKILYNGANMVAVLRNSANSANFTATSGPGSLDPNKWHHVVVVYNGATLKIYVGGVEVASVSATSMRSADLSFLIGHDNSTYFDGRQAEIGLYSEALSADQIATWYANEKDSGFWVVTEHTGVGGDPTSGSFFFG